MKILILFFALLVLSYSSAHALEGHYNREDMYEPPAASRIPLDVYAIGTLGNMFNAKGDMAGRTMLTWTPALSLGLRLRPFILGIYGEYNLSYQLTSASSVANQNESGQGYLFGGMLKVEARKLFFAGTVVLLGQYEISQPTSTGQTSTYSSPLGYSVLVGHEISQNVSIFLTAKLVSFSHWNLADISNDKVTQIQYGLGLNFAVF